MYNFFSMQKQEIITIINRALEDEFEISKDKFLPEANVKSVLSLDSLDMVKQALLLKH